MTKKMSLKVTLFPRVLSLSKVGYIPDYVNAINQSGNMEVVNPPHKNPLLNILSPQYWGDVFIFNWPENIPDARFGKIQTLLFFGLIGILKLRKKKIIWMFHNKMSHNKSHPFTKSLIMKAMARASTLIVAHAQEGAALVKASYPHAGKKTHFLDHPTKSRLEYMPAHINKVYDLLIWGGISEYKGVLQFVQYIREKQTTNLKVCIIGKCSPPSLRERLREALPQNVTYIDERPSFEELASYMARSRFVLCTYQSESVLSSMMLMDSLSYGCKIIGPDTGSFKDYSHEPRLKVYTFDGFPDIEGIVERHKDDTAVKEDYKDFLTEKDWPHFIRRLSRLIASPSASK